MAATLRPAAYPEGALVRDMDGKSGASLILTALNDKGRVGTMVAGGGASIVYAGTVADYGWGHEPANYGEYSGAPPRRKPSPMPKHSFHSMCLRPRRPDTSYSLMVSLRRWRSSWIDRQTVLEKTELHSKHAFDMSMQV